MCGIFGYIDFSGINNYEGFLKRMSEAIKYRGPDASGFRIIKNEHASVFLGSNRLKVIDLSDQANQPMTNETESIWLVFNGEIYNYLELRSTLEKKGHKFKTNSDTETIVHAYEEYGENFVQKLDGMFAALIWDSKENKAVLVRDRTGKKPLYYHFNGRTFAFASEIKALLECSWVEKKIEERNITEYLAYGYVKSPNTMYENIYQVMPASLLVISSKGLERSGRYWNLDFHNKQYDISNKDAIKKTRDLTIRAIEKRLVSDVPLGILLSGGLDSSIIAGTVSKILGKKISAFTVGFNDEASFDERQYARMVAEKNGIDLTELSVKMDPINMLEKILFHFDQPYSDTSAIPTFLVCEAARKQVTVALNGDGADEVFAGYDRFRAAILAEHIPGFIWPIGKMLAGRLPRTYGYYDLKRRMERFFNAEGDDLIERHRNWIMVFDYKSLLDLLKPRMKEQILKVFNEERRILESVSDLKILHKLLYLNFMTYLPDNLNVKMDRMSMANSLETRSPFLDRDLIDFAATLPRKFKVRGRITKFALREAFSDIIPDDVRYRPKHGFGSPVSLWLKKDLSQLAKQFLLSEDARCAEYLNAEEIKRLYSEHLNGTADHGNRLWALLQLELWLRKF